MEATNSSSPASKIIERFSNWSKWLITLSFTSGIGCIIAMKTASEAALQKTGPLFFLAILFFVLSIAYSVFFIFLLADEKQAVNDNGSIKYTWLAKSQLICFCIGVIFVLIWLAFLSGLI